MKDRELQEIAAAFSLDWVDEFEGRVVQIRRCTTHGDLHGENILINHHGHPMIIDYGSIGPGLAPFDPITLEFSHFFHPDGPHRNSEWPNKLQASKWRSDAYLVNCPTPIIPKVCWKWAETVSAGHREIAAAAYIFLIAQLGYPNTNKERVLSLLEGVRNFYEST